MSHDVAIFLCLPVILACIGYILYSFLAFVRSFALAIEVIHSYESDWRGLD